MPKNWISNTIFISGFQDIQELFNFMSTLRDIPRNENGLVQFEDYTIDLEYFAVNISNIQNKLRLSMSFLTDRNFVRDKMIALYPISYTELKVTHAVIDTRTEAVELYNFTGSELTSHKSIPRGLGRPLLDDLERLPDPDKNLSFTVQDIDVLDYGEFAAIITTIFPRYNHPN